jgi:hypothetical protein
VLAVTAAALAVGSSACGALICPRGGVSTRALCLWSLQEEAFDQWRDLCAILLYLPQQAAAACAVGQANQQAARGQGLRWRLPCSLAHTLCAPYSWNLLPSLVLGKSLLGVAVSGSGGLGLSHWGVHCTPFSLQLAVR